MTCHESVTYLTLDRHRAVQRDDRPITMRRVVAAREDRRDGDDQAGVPGVLDYGFYDGRGPQTHVLHRPLAQRDRAVLQGPELRDPTTTKWRPPATTTSREWFRPNPPLPYIKWGPRKQHQHPAVGADFSLITSRRTASCTWITTGANKTFYEAGRKKGRNGRDLAWLGDPLESNTDKAGRGGSALNELRPPRARVSAIRGLRGFSAGSRDVSAWRTGSSGGTSPSGRLTRPCYFIVA
jgi:hypothetical protein